MWKIVTGIFGRVPLSESHEWVRGVAKARKMAAPFHSPAAAVVVSRFWWKRAVSLLPEELPSYST